MSPTWTIRRTTNFVYSRLLISSAVTITGQKSNDDPKHRMLIVSAVPSHLILG